MADPDTSDAPPTPTAGAKARGEAPDTEPTTPGPQPKDPDRLLLKNRAYELRREDPAYWTYPRLAAELDVSEHTVRSWVTPRDPKPRRRRPSTKKPSAENVRARTRVLEQALGQILVFPAVPSAMLAPTDEGRMFLVAHFTSAGPRTAHTLAVASETSPELRELLENLVKGSTRATIAFALVGYAGPPLLWLFGMQQLAVGLSQVQGADEAELAAAFAQMPPMPHPAGHAESPNGAPKPGPENPVEPPAAAGPPPAG